MAGLTLRIRHLAECPEDNPVVCAESPYEPYLHDQHVLVGRALPQIAIGLGSGWQTDLLVPIELRVVRVDYSDVDGNPLDAPPGGGIHHRDETLFGLGDSQLRVGRFARIDAITVGAMVGTTLPFGRTTEDPYALTEQGLPHEHLALGSGTLDPLVSLQLTSNGTWSGFGSIDSRLPVYEGQNGFRGARTVNLSAGIGYRPIHGISLFASLDPLMETPERWHGEPHGGRFALMGTVGGAYVITPTVSLQGLFRTTFVTRGWPGSEHGDEQLVQRVVVGLDLTVRPKKRATPDLPGPQERPSPE